MTFFDWWAYLGTFVQSFYSWTTYNAGQFNANIGWRQAQQYQKKNYSIAWITVARDDIRDMMSISVNRINNYMIVATLILSVAAGAIVSIGMDDRVPDHVVFSIYISIGSSVTFLMLSILFGVKGQNTAFTRTMKLLTYQMRPEPTAEYSHNYMKQSQWLERGGMAKMFRFPGIYPEYDIEKAAAKANENMRPPVPQSPTKGASSGSASTRGPMALEASLEDATPIETLEIRSQQTTYLAKFANYMQFWLPYDVFAKYTMGMGVIALGQGSAYFALAQLITQGRFLIGVPMVCLSATFLITVVIVIQQNYKSDRWNMRFLAIVTACAGNIFATISAINRHFYLVDAICIPLSYLSHAVFYYVAPCVAQKGWNQEDLLQDFGSAGTEEEEQRVRESLDGGPDGLTRGSGYAATDAQDQWEDADEERHLLDSNAAAASDAAHVSPTEEASMKRRRNKPVDDGGFYTVQHDDFGPSGDWGMSQDRYRLEKDRTQTSVLRTVRWTLRIISLIWLIMFVWSALDALEPSIVKADYLVQAVNYNEVNVAWPNPLFRPTRLACDNNSIFISDSHNIFELLPLDGPGTWSAQRAWCDHADPIIDLTVDCSAGRCHPLALVQRPSGELEVFNCSSSKSLHLRLDGFKPHMLAFMPPAPSLPESISSSSTVMPPSVGNGSSQQNVSLAAIRRDAEDHVLSSGRRLSNVSYNSTATPTASMEGRTRILVAREDAEAMQTVLNLDGDALIPEWPLGTISNGIVGLGVAPEIVLTVRSHKSSLSQYTAANHFLAVLNRTTMELVNRWAPLYKDMNVATDGCPFKGGMEALILVSQTDSIHGSKPAKLMSMSLVVSQPYRWDVQVE